MVEEMTALLSRSGRAIATF